MRRPPVVVDVLNHVSRENVVGSLTAIGVETKLVDPSNTYAPNASRGHATALDVSDTMEP
jgi:hypothetical protein